MTVKLKTPSNGSVSLTPQDTASDVVVTVPAGTSTMVTNATLPTQLNASGSAPIYACRAWVNFNGTGTPAIRASGNVSSITDNGTGNYTVNFTTAMTDINFCTQASCAIATATIEGIQTVQASNTVNSCLVFTRNRSTGTFYDSVNVDVAIFR